MSFIWREISLCKQKTFLLFNLQYLDHYSSAFKKERKHFAEVEVLHFAQTARVRQMQNKWKAIKSYIVTSA
jgi:flagellar biosynthesis/type III secretory pathway chaperone